MTAWQHRHVVADAVSLEVCDELTGQPDRKRQIVASVDQEHRDVPEATNIGVRADRQPHDAVENIDIGGPTMLRSAAKNFKHVAVVVDPADYATILEELDNNESVISDATRMRRTLRAS